MAKKSTKHTRVSGIICPKCQSFLYSVHRHDFHSCGSVCGLSFIDGGFDYNHFGFMYHQKEFNVTDIKRLKVKINKSKHELLSEYLNHNLRFKRQSGIIYYEDMDEIFKVLYMEGKKVK